MPVIDGYGADPHDEEHPDWDGTPPLELSVPEGSNARARAAYTATCDQCQGTIGQAYTECPECGRPVNWSNSVIFEKKQRMMRNAASDMKAKARSEAGQRMSSTTELVLTLARATAVTHSFVYAKGQELALFQYEKAYGKELIEKQVNKFKADGDRGAQLVKHLINWLGTYKPEAGKTGVVSISRWDH